MERKKIVEKILNCLILEDYSCSNYLIETTIKRLEDRVVDKENARAEAYALLYQILMSFDFKHYDDLIVLDWLSSIDNLNIGTKHHYEDSKRQFFRYFMLKVKKLGRTEFYYERLKEES